MEDSVYRAFLLSQYEQGQAFASTTDRLRLIPYRGDPPTHYLAEFYCTGLAKDAAGQVVKHGVWQIGVHFPEDYLRQPPEVPRILTYLGTARDPFHPNIRPPFICLSVVTGMPLVEILCGLYDLLTWNLYSTSDEGLNHAAAQWARHQDPAQFPVDRRPLRRRVQGGPVARPTRSV
jgi:ubiquitin-protein ligase